MEILYRLFFFILLMEGLNITIEDANDADIYSGVQIDRRDLKIFYFLYANDVIILGDWDS